MTTNTPHAFKAGERFELIRELGSGGMGVVFEVCDRERDVRVALKTLLNLNPASLYRFKREFRALADVTHPNLVSLYELIEDKGQWFFTMELVDGVSFLDYLRGVSSRPTDSDDPSTATSDGLLADITATSDGRLASITATSEHTQPTLLTPPVSPVVSSSHVFPPAPAERLWQTLPQLTAALLALHASGHLHRDIKPNNVMVTADGRVVVLDFGVITELTGAPARPRGSSFVGTPRYVAPEQIAGDAEPTPASDWYSVGVMLYEALTGRRLFAGTPRQIVDAKRNRDADPPSAAYPGVDPQLEEICVRLLEREPRKRLTGEQLNELLRSNAKPAPTPSGAPASPAADQLIGRESQLDTLTAAFESTRAGKGRSLLVNGKSGIGKTALVNQFLAEVISRTSALVLAGRCYERESVPYQAIDSLVDSLCQFLLDLPRLEADALMPVDVRSLARAFPVLNRVEAVAKAPRRSTAPVSDPQELRRRAFAALRELIARLAEQRPLVLFIDDIQWGDADSAPFVGGLMRPPAPPLLFLASYRSEEATSSAFLAALRAEAEDAGSTAPPLDELAITELTADNAHRLAAALLREAHANPEAAAAIATESAGNPFLIHEFVRFVASSPDAGDLEKLSIAEMIATRTGGLSAAARQLLQLVAVAGHPIAQEIIQRAAELGSNTPRALTELRAAHMVRTSGSRAYDSVETYHDRIRETVVAGLSATTLRELHLQLARGIGASDRADAESLAVHYAAAGELDLALTHAKRAADVAADALAFERAAAMYGLALELTPEDEQGERSQIGRRLGDALVYAGRGVDAAEAYMAAAAAATGKNALDLQVRAGSELLRNGRVDEGVEALRPALAGAGVKLASTPRRALYSLVFRRAHIRLRGLRYRVRSEEEISPHVLSKIDAFGAASGALGMADTIRGAEIQSRHVLATLRHGDPIRVGRSLVYETAYSSLGGFSTLRRSRRILALLQTIAEETGEPLLEGLHAGMSSLTAYQCGEWRLCKSMAEKADEILRSKCQGVAWELTSVQLYRVWALFWLGEYDEQARQTRRFVREARERGDLYAEVSLSTSLAAFHGLAADDPEGTSVRIERAFSQWTTRGFHLQHYWAHVAQVQCVLYAGDPASAYQQMIAKWTIMKRVFMFKISMVRAEMFHLRARAALAIAHRSGDKRELKRAARDVRRFSRVPLRWIRPATQLLRAALADMAGDHNRAMQLLRGAENGFRAEDMRTFAATARRCRGLLLGGEQGLSMFAEGDAELRACGVANPPRMSLFMAPGLPAEADPAADDDRDDE